MQARRRFPPDADARHDRQNFVSAATGMAVLVALIRGFGV
jgi:hypothetical protein